MRSPLLALLVVAALAPWDRAVCAQEAGAAAGPAAATAEAPKAKAIEPIVPPVRRVMPVTPPPSKDIKGVNSGPKSKTAGPGTACKPRKGLKASCAPAAATAPAAKAKPAAKSAAKPSKTAPKTAAKSATRPAAKNAGRTAASGK